LSGREFQISEAATVCRCALAKQRQQQSRLSLSRHRAARIRQRRVNRSTLSHVSTLISQLVRVLQPPRSVNLFLMCLLIVACTFLENNLLQLLFISTVTCLFVATSDASSKMHVGLRLVEKYN